MALTECEECGREVSTKAGKCPSCGAPQKKSRKPQEPQETPKQAGCATVVASLTIIGFLFAFLASQRTTEMETQDAAKPSGPRKLGTTAQSTKSKSSGSPWQDFQSRPNAEQTEMLALIVNGTGKAYLPTGSIYKGKVDDGSAYYALTCRNGNNWMVTLVDDAEGSSRVTSCATMKMVGVDCFETWDE